MWGGKVVERSGTNRFLCMCLRSTNCCLFIFYCLVSTAHVNCIFHFTIRTAFEDSRSKWVIIINFPKLTAIIQLNESHHSVFFFFSWAAKHASTQIKVMAFSDCIFSCNACQSFIHSFIRKVVLVILFMYVASFRLF